MDFFTLMRILNNKKGAVKLPMDIIREYLWPMLSHPHQGRFGYETKKKNQCLKHLPKLELWTGPKIIYNLKRLEPLFDLTKSYKYPATIKFMYTLKYSKKYPNEYINILEYVTLKPSDFIYTNNSLDMGHFSSRIREIYALPFNNCEKKLELSVPLIYSGY